MKALVVGGGIFGVTTAIELAKANVDTTLIEQNQDLMLGATNVNQNRFHLGYHYPRSLATAKQCQEGIPSFKEYFDEALIDVKENYYAISKNGSRVSFEQYIKFCEKLNLPHEEKFPANNILNAREVSGCISVKEQIIDLEKMKLIAKRLLKKTKVKVFLNRQFQIEDKNKFQIIVNATYSSLNRINQILNLPVKKYRYDICNVPVLNLPKELSGIGVTIMDGNFYSILPYSKTPYHLLWNVESSAVRSVSKYPPLNHSDKTANYKDSTYIPSMKNAKLIDTLRVIKVLRPDVELSDERITDLIDYGNGYFAILSAKLNTCVLTARRLVDTVKTRY